LNLKPTAKILRFAQDERKGAGDDRRSILSHVRRLAPTLIVCRRADGRVSRQGAKDAKGAKKDGRVSRKDAKYAKGAKRGRAKVLYFLCALGVLCALA
jgi:hypothetical protein